MNCNDDLEMLNFDHNDLKVIEQNNPLPPLSARFHHDRPVQETIKLRDSIFLRYLPLPMIIKTLQDRELLADQDAETSFLNIF